MFYWPDLIDGAFGRASSCPKSFVSVVGVWRW